MTDQIRPKNPLKFHYIGNRKNPSETGIITVATEVTGGGHSVRLGFAFCSPKDQFSKKIGRKIALDRMKGSWGHTLGYGGHSTDAIVSALGSIYQQFLPKIWRNHKFWTTGNGEIEYEKLAKKDWEFHKSTLEDEGKGETNQGIACCPNCKGTKWRFKPIGDSGMVECVACKKQERIAD